MSQRLRCMDHDVFASIHASVHPSIHPSIHPWRLTFLFAGSTLQGVASWQSSEILQDEMGDWKVRILRGDLEPGVSEIKSPSESGGGFWWFINRKQTGVNFILTLEPPVPHIFGFLFFYEHIKYHILNMVKIKCDINQQDLKRVDLHFVKS